jgi:hypothetical protein
VLPSTEVEIVTAAQVDTAELNSLAVEITSKVDLIFGHEGAFQEATLEHRLEIGLHIAKAQEIFTLTNAESGSIGGTAKASVSRRDTLAAESPEILATRGFSSWLKANIPRLKRGRAIKYATGFRSLSLPLTAKPADIQAKVKTLFHEADKAKKPRPNLADLVKAAPKPSKPETLTILLPKSSKQLKLEDARETFALWMQAFDKAVKQGHLEHLDRKGLEQLKDFTATVRDRINARLK